MRECGLWVLAVILTRWPCRSHYLYDIDSVNFALGLSRFDPTAHQPHPPGYFLYICLGRFSGLFFKDANAALVAISIVASCGAVIAVYLLASDWFGPRAASFAASLFLFSPLAWFHGTVALIYIVEAFLSGLLGWLCWRMYRGASGYALPAALLLGLGAGIRPSFLLFLAPVFLLSIWRVPRKSAAAALLVLLLALASWFFPMAQAAGGLKTYLSSLWVLWQLQGGQHTALNSSPVMSLARAITIVLIYGLAFGSAAFLPLCAGRRRDETAAEIRLFTALWLTPALLFFALVFLRLVNSGYLLVLFPPASAWLGRWAADWYSRGGWPKPLKVSVIGLAAATNVLIFWRAPLPSSYRSVRTFEAELERVREAVPQVVSPGETLLLGFDSHFLGYRHVGYYLPQFLVAQYPEVSLPGGWRVFTMHNRDTEVVERLHTGALRNILLIPVSQSGQGHREYMAKIQAMLPSNELRSVHAAGQDFWLAPISELARFFPHAAEISSSVNGTSLKPGCCIQPFTNTIPSSAQRR